MKQNLFFVLIAVAILYLMYSFSKNKSFKKNSFTKQKQKQNHKNVKESFNADYETIHQFGHDILSEPVSIEDSPAFWERLNSNLFS